MADYKLADGTILTDEEIEREGAMYEAGTWSGHLEHVCAGELSDPIEETRMASVRFPKNTVDAMNDKTINR